MCQRLRTTQSASPLDHPLQVGIELGSADRGDVEEVLRYPGTLVSSDTVTLVPKLAGRVEMIRVSEGDLVKAGSLLVVLEAEGAALQVGQAKSAWNAALAQLRKAERGVRDAELESAQASLQQAEEDLAVAERNLDRSTRLYEAGVSMGGTVSGEHGLGSVKKQYLPIAFGEAEIELMRRIKRAFDPNSIMNPGKVFDTVPPTN